MKINRGNTTSIKRKLRIAYIAADVFSAIVTWVFLLLFRWAMNDNREITPDTFISVFDFYLPLVLYPIGCIFIHYLTGYYVNPYKKNIVTDIVTTIASAFIITFAAFFTFIIDDITINHTTFYDSIGALFALQFSTTVLLRLCVTCRTRNIIKRGKLTFNVAIIGCNNKAQSIADEVEGNLFGHKIVGYIKTKYDTKNKIKNSDIIGNIKNIKLLKSKFNIDSVIISIEDGTNEIALFEIISQLYSCDLEIQFTPRIYEILTGTAQIDKLNLSPLVNITESSMPDWQMSIKRLLDILVSAASLLVTAPFILYFGIRIKFDSSGKIFYKQERIGRLGKPFQIIKFRTMYENSENGIPQLSKGQDDRVTKYGHFLRKYRIDEIPQFWNVLKGEMSLVGPRPERSFFIEKITQKAPYYCLIYKIRPGLTSWGPIKIGYSDTIEKMIQRLNYDMIYMDNMSIVTDMKILLYTIEVIIKGKGQ